MASKFVRCTGDKRCPYHLKNELTFFCETCGFLICNKCIASQAHRGHKLIDLGTVVEEKYIDLQDLNSEITRYTIPEIEENTKTADEDFDETVKVIHTRIEAIDKQEEYLKSLVEIYALSSRNKYKADMKEYQEYHDQYKYRMSLDRKSLENIVKENTEATKSDNNILIIDLANDTRRKVNVQKYQKPSVPNFIPGSEPENVLQTAFGSIEETIKDDFLTPDDKETEGETDPKLLPIPMSSPKHESEGKTDLRLLPIPMSSPKHESEGKIDLRPPSIPMRRLKNDSHTKAVRPNSRPPPLPNRKVPNYTNITLQPNSKTLIGDLPTFCIKEITQLSNIPKSIVVRKDGTICILYNSSPDLTLVSSTGKTTNLTFDSDMSDIALDPDTDQLYCLNQNEKDVRILNLMSGKCLTKVLFNVQECVSRMAVTGETNFILGERENPLIHVYTETGVKIQTVECVEVARHITVCPFTGKVAVAVGAKGIEVFDAKYNKLAVQCKSIESSTDVQFDAHGNILVGDYYKKTVHVLNAMTGQYIKAIPKYKLPGYVPCIALQDNGELVVGTIGKPNKLLAIKYIQ